MKLILIPFANPKLHALLLDSSNQYDSKMKVANLTPSHISVLARPVLVQLIYPIHLDPPPARNWGLMPVEILPEATELYHRTGVSSQYLDRPDRKPPKKIIQIFLGNHGFCWCFFFFLLYINPCYTWFLWESGWNVSINSLESRQVRRNQVVAPSSQTPGGPTTCPPPEVS